MDFFNKLLSKLEIKLFLIETFLPLGPSSLLLETCFLGPPITTLSTMGTYSSYP